MGAKAKGRYKTGKPTGKRPKEKKGLPEEFEDEVDVFHKSHDKISFEESDSDQDLEELDDEAVYNLSDDEDADEDSDDEDETIRRLEEEEARARKRLAVLRAGQDSDEEAEPSSEEDEEEERPVGVKSWGKKKKAYYVREGEEEEVDEEEDSEYEREARRQQQEAAAQLRPEDYGAAFSDEGDDDSDEDEKETLGHRSRLDGGVEEKVEREGAAALLPEERRAAILADAPVLADVLTEMQSSLDELRTRISPLLQELKGGQIATADGLSYLEAKNHLLLHYIATLAFLVLLRAEGRPFQEHPAVLRVVELRALLDKIRPLDRRLAYQVDRLVSAVRHLRAAGTGPRGEEDGEGAAGAGPQGMAEDPLQFRPKPEALQVGEGGAADGAAGDGIYRPPRLNPVSMDDDPDKDTQRAERRREEHRRRKAGRSEFVQSMVADYLGAPEEVHIGGDLEQSTSMRTLRDRFKHRSEMEEELFIRRNLSKEERKALASHKRAALSGGMLLEDLADDITGIIQEGEDAKKASTADEMWQRQRVSQKFGADLSEAGLAGRSKRSGDADLPFREPLSDRRARMDSVRALKDRRGKDNGDFSEGDVEEFDFGGSKKGKEGSKKKRVRTADEDEDPFYRETAKKSKMRKEARGAEFAPRPLPPPVAPEPATGPRGVTREVLHNRGLTPSRPKSTKNPRVRNRQKFVKKTQRRKGQVVDVRPAQQAYGGEATGIKAGVSKSRRF